jgi:hypothetical protein
LLRIEEELGAAARFSGFAAFSSTDIADRFANRKSAAKK